MSVGNLEGGSRGFTKEEVRALELIPPPRLPPLSSRGCPPGQEALEIRVDDPDPVVTQIDDRLENQAWGAQRVAALPVVAVREHDPPRLEVSETRDGHPAGVEGKQGVVAPVPHGHVPFIGEIPTEKLEVRSGTVSTSLIDECANVLQIGEEFPGKRSPVHVHHVLKIERRGHVDEAAGIEQRRRARTHVAKSLQKHPPLEPRRDDVRLINLRDALQVHRTLFSTSLENLKKLLDEKRQ